MENVNKTQTALRRLGEIKKLFQSGRNASQDAYNDLMPHFKKLICFHAGLQQRHISMDFQDLLVNERKAVIRALNEIQALAAFLPQRLEISDSCIENTEIKEN